MTNPGSHPLCAVLSGFGASFNGMLATKWLTYRLFKPFVNGYLGCLTF